jgi:HlyD family secretion protein
MMRRIAVASSLLVAVALLAVYFYGPSNEGQPRFQTAPVERGPLAATVTTTGTLNAVTTVQVGTEVSGQVRELFADFNSQVKQGQVIARIAPETFEAKVGQARAELDAAQAGVVNQRAQVARARADVATAQAQVFNQRSQVERANADVGNARSTLVAARAQTAKSSVAVLDTKRDLTRKTELFGKGLIARSDMDSAQAAHDSAVAQLDASRAQEQALASTIRSAEAQLASAKSQEEAFAAGVQSAKAQLEVAEAQQKQAEATVRQKRAALQQAQVDLEHTYIRSPVNGVVISRNVDVGQTVAASLAAPTLFTIAQDLTQMQIDTNVDESDIGRIEQGQQATFMVDSFPGERFFGVVTQVRKAAKVVQNVVTYNVVISVDNPGQRLLPGMTTTIRITVASRSNALKVPNAALLFRPGEAAADPAGSGGAAALDGAVSHTRRGVPSLEELRAELARDLVLSDEQKKRLEPILRQRQQQLGELERLPKEQQPDAVIRINGAIREKVRAILTQEQQALYDGQGTGSGKRWSRPGVVWALDHRGAPHAIWLQLGITDGSFTEVLGGDVKAGERVVVAAVFHSRSGGLFSPIGTLRFRE